MAPRRPKLGVVNAEYIFLDVVAYSKRTVEAQAHVIEILNDVVRAAVGAVGLGSDRVIYIPTGDGICMALLNMSHPFSYDVQMRIALGILERLHDFNLQQSEEELRFDVRIGLNAGKDNVIQDINQHRNISGKGINEAARIMDKADGGQILVGSAVFENLNLHREYKSAFRQFTVPVKWGFLTIYQFIGKGYSYLNLQVPKSTETIPDIQAKKGPKSREARLALKSGGLKIRIEIGPPEIEVQWAELTRVKLKTAIRVTGLIDTGASRTIINPQLAVTCGLRQIGAARISAVGQILEVPEYAGAMRFPDTSLKGFDPIALLACSLPSQDVSCVIGRDILDRWRLLYDGRTGEVQIED